MSLAGKYYDSHNTVWSLWGGSSEYNWFWGTIEGLIPGDQYGTGPIPMPSPGPNVPDAISEEPQTWEELEELEPELFEPILETRPGRVADSYPQDVAESEHPEDDEVAHTWTHWGQELIGDVIGGWLGPDTPAVYNPPDAFAPGPTVGPTTGGGTTTMNGAACDGMTWSGAAPPKGYKVVNHCGVGVLRKIRRRRRPRIATNSDLADISAIVGIVGKGQLATALISRRGR